MRLLKVEGSGVSCLAPGTFITALGAEQFEHFSVHCLHSPPSTPIFRPSKRVSTVLALQALSVPEYRPRSVT